MTMSDDLIERCAEAAFRAALPHRSWAKAKYSEREPWLGTARAVLFEAAAQPPAPITAEDVRAALKVWSDLGWREQRSWHAHYEEAEATFVADYLNRGGER